jgi:hypothetical protein
MFRCCFLDEGQGQRGVQEGQCHTKSGTAERNPTKPVSTAEKVKRVSAEKATITKKAEATAMERGGSSNKPDGDHSSSADVKKPKDKAGDETANRAAKRVRTADNTSVFVCTRPKQRPV